jgi:hypothetical protein
MVPWCLKKKITLTKQGGKGKNDGSREPLLGSPGAVEEYKRMSVRNNDVAIRTAIRTLRCMLF